MPVYPAPSQQDLNAAMRSVRSDDAKYIIGRMAVEPDFSRSLTPMEPGSISLDYDRALGMTSSGVRVPLICSFTVGNDPHIARKTALVTAGRLVFVFVEAEDGQTYMFADDGIHGLRFAIVLQPVIGRIVNGNRTEILKLFR